MARLTKSQVANKALLHGITFKQQKNSDVFPYKLETIDNQKNCRNLQDALDNIEFFVVNGIFKDQKPKKTVSNESRFSQAIKKLSSQDSDKFEYLTLV